MQTISVIVKGKSEEEREEVSKLLYQFLEKKDFRVDVDLSGKSKNLTVKAVTALFKSFTKKISPRKMDKTNYKLLISTAE